MKPKILIASGEGFNAENELSYAWKLSGAAPEIVHINTIMKTPSMLRGYQAFCLPGGFAFGDHLGAGKALSSKIEFSGSSKANLFEELVSYPENGKIIFGVCNGFQVLSKLGFFPGKGQEYGTRNFALASNASGKFYDGWVTLVAGNKHFSSSGIRQLRAPVRHGEGRVIFASEKERNNTEKEGRILFKYADGKLKPTMKYPMNPNGSTDAIAGLTDKTGFVIGMMPHPEAAIIPENDPRNHGLKAMPKTVPQQIFFRNLVRKLKETQGR